MTDRREEIVVEDTMMVDLAGVGAAVEIASNIEVPTEPIEDSGVVVDMMDENKSKKKRKRKMKHVDQIHSQIESQESDEESKRSGQPTTDSSVTAPYSMPSSAWNNLPSNVHLKFMQSMLAHTQSSNSDGLATPPNAKSNGEASGKTPSFPTPFPSYYTPYGPMAFIPVPLMAGFQQDGKSSWPQALAQKFPMIFQSNKMAPKNGSSEPSGDSDDMVTDSAPKQPTKKGEMPVEEDLEGDKPIPTSVITARTPNKRSKAKPTSSTGSGSSDSKQQQQQQQQSVSNKQDKTLKTALPIMEDSGAVVDEEETQQCTSPASSDSTNTSTSGLRNVLLRVSEAHLFLLQDEDGDTALHLAVIHERVDFVRKMVKTIAGVYMNLDIANHMRQTPLHLAVITKQPLIVEALVKAGASVNFPDRKGNTSTHLAAQRRDLKSLQELAKATSPLPDYNAKNFQGLTPVHLATQESSKDVLKFLFDSGANKNSGDTTCGRTGLHYAVEQENVQLVNFLIQEGCDTNAATFSGNTSLHIAAGRKMKDIVALLMAYGANPSIVNSEGDVPHDLPPAILYSRAKRV